MACDNLVSVKNISIVFEDCATGQRVGPIIHDQSNDDLPTIRTCTFTNEALNNGYIKRNHTNASITMSVVRNLGIPLAFYQGCARVDVQIEFENGLVYSGQKGTPTGDDKSDSHDVSMDVVFRHLDEMLPPDSYISA